MNDNEIVYELNLPDLGSRAYAKRQGLVTVLFCGFCGLSASLGKAPQPEEVERSVRAHAGHHVGASALDNLT